MTTNSESQQDKPQIKPPRRSDWLNIYDESLDHYSAANRWFVAALLFAALMMVIGIGIAIVALVSHNNGSDFLLIIFSTIIFVMGLVFTIFRLTLSGETNRARGEDQRIESQ